MLDGAVIFTEKFQISEATGYRRYESGARGWYIRVNLGPYVAVFQVEVFAIFVMEKETTMAGRFLQ